MTYCLDDDFLKKLLTIRSDYEQIKKIDLDKTPQPYAVSCFFGATNIKARDNQTRFIQKLLEALDDALLKPDALEKENILLVKPEALKKHVDALRVLMVLAFYIKSQVDKTYTIRSSSSAELIRLLDSALKLDEGFVIDEETRSVALHTAQEFVASKGRRDKLNQTLNQKISVAEWKGLTHFIDNQCLAIEKKPTLSLPVTSLIVPPCEWTMEMTGYTTGYILGKVISKSTESQPVRALITSGLSSLFYFAMGPSGTVAFMLVAPTYAGKLVETFFGVISAAVCGSTMKTIGKGVGFAVGLPIDLSCKAVYQACLALSSLLHGKKTHHLTGFNLVTGQRVVEGTEMNLIKTTEENLKKVFAENEKSVQPIPMQVTETDLIIHGPDGNPIHLPLQEAIQPYMVELKEKFSQVLISKGVRVANPDQISDVDPLPNAQPIIQDDEADPVALKQPDESTQDESIEDDSALQRCTV